MVFVCRAIRFTCIQSFQRVSFMAISHISLIGIKKKIRCRYAQFDCWIDLVKQKSHINTRKFPRRLFRSVRYKSLELFQLWYCHLCAERKTIGEKENIYIYSIWWRWQCCHFDSHHELYVFRCYIKMRPKWQEKHKSKKLLIHIQTSILHIDSTAIDHAMIQCSVDVFCRLGHKVKRRRWPSTRQHDGKQHKRPPNPILLPFYYNFILDDHQWIVIRYYIYPAKSPDYDQNRNYARSRWVSSFSLRKRTKNGKCVIEHSELVWNLMNLCRAHTHCMLTATCRALSSKIHSLRRNLLFCLYE